MRKVLKQHKENQVGKQHFAHLTSPPQDHFYLLKALELAETRRGFCSPNPSVGAVIVNQHDEMIATGYHDGPGTPHAEINALHGQISLTGATVYVTLEPCCHWGRTPPCTDALIQAGIKRVIYGYQDPNPIVSGKGSAALEAAGIECKHLPLAEIIAFYESYQYWTTHHKPFVTAKIALSMNGVIAGSQGERLQITGSVLNEFTHYSRKKTDAILTTVQTIIHDDPALNARYLDETIAKPLYILDSQLRLPKTAKIFNTAQSITLFYDENIHQEKCKSFIDLQVRCLPVKSNQQGLDLSQVMQLIGQDGVHDLWIEAGGKCFAASVEEQLVRRALIYIAPRWFVNGQIAFPNGLSFDESVKIKWQQFGKDVLCDIRW